MKSHPFVVESPLSAQECIHRLQQSISDSGMGFVSIGDFGNEQFHGTIDGNSIELRKRKSFFWRNDFAPHLFADLEPTSSGTRIKGYFGLGTRVAWFMTIWQTIVIVIGSVFIIQFVRADTDHRDWTGVAVPMGMAAWGFLLPRISYYFSSWHERELLEFVKTTLLAN